MKQFQFRLNELKDGLKSVFSDRTDSASAVQYFQVLVIKVFLSDSQQKYKADKHSLLFYISVLCTCMHMYIFFCN